MSCKVVLECDHDYTVILCPVCTKGKFVDLGNSAGTNSVKCEKCHQTIAIDWDKKTARRIEPLKRVS